MDPLLLDAKKAALRKVVKPTPTPIAGVSSMNKTLPGVVSSSLKKSLPGMVKKPLAKPTLTRL